jgi:predicted RNase H-like nuclease
MANARIFQDVKLLLDFVVPKNDFSSKVNEEKRRVALSNITHSASKVKEKHYPNSLFKNLQRKVIVREELPFRVRFINKGFLAYGPENPPPIGVAVIGFNNYIL